MTGSGFAEDCLKFNYACGIYGWVVLRFTTEMVESGEAIDMIRKVLRRVGDGSSASIESSRENMGSEP